MTLTKVISVKCLGQKSDWNGYKNGDLQIRSFEQVFIFLSTGLQGFLGRQRTVSFLLASPFTKLSVVPAPLKCSGNTCGVIRDLSIGYRLSWWLRW